MGVFPLFWGPLFPLCIACTSSRLLEGGRGEKDARAKRGVAFSAHLSISHLCFAASRVSIWSRSAGVPC